MNRDLSHLESISIFWSESSTYIFIYAAYALVVCAVVCYMELNFQKGTSIGLGKLALSNASLAILATLLFSASMLVSGWYSRYLGGEVSAFLLTLLVTALLLYLFKAFLIDHYALKYESTRLPGIYIAAILVAPYSLFSVFFYLLGSAFRN